MIISSEMIVAEHSHNVTVDAVSGIVTVSISGYDGITDLTPLEARRLAVFLLNAADASSHAE
jgi:hypothetical protein